MASHCQEIFIRRLKSEDEFDEADAFRRQYMRLMESADDDFEQIERYRDRLGRVFSFTSDGVLVGTVRLVPIGYGLSLSEKLFGAFLHENGQQDRITWEIGRLALHPSVRSPMVLSKCFELVTTWFWVNTPAEMIYAVAEPHFVRLYRRFAFKPVGGASQGDDGRRNYVLIGSPLEEVVKVFHENPKKIIRKYLQGRRLFSGFVAMRGSVETFSKATSGKTVWHVSGELAASGDNSMREATIC